MKIIHLAPVEKSAKLLVRIPSKEMNMFRYLLEPMDNLALFTVLSSNRNTQETLVKLLFSKHQEKDVHVALQRIQELVSINWTAYPKLGIVPESEL